MPSQPVKGSTARGWNVRYPYLYNNKAETNSLIIRSSTIILFTRFYRHCFHCNLIRKSSYNESTPVFISGTLKYNGFVLWLSLTLLRLMANVSCLTHSCSSYISGWFLLVLLKKFQQIEFLSAINAQWKFFVMALIKREILTSCEVLHS